MDDYQSSLHVCFAGPGAVGAAHAFAAFVHEGRRLPERPGGFWVVAACEGAVAIGAVFCELAGLEEGG